MSINKFARLAMLIPSFMMVLISALVLTNSASAQGFLVPSQWPDSSFIQSKDTCTTYLKLVRLLDAYEHNTVLTFVKTPDFVSLGNADSCDASATLRSDGRVEISFHAQYESVKKLAVFVLDTECHTEGKFSSVDRSTYSYQTGDNQDSTAWFKAGNPTIPFEWFISVLEEMEKRQFESKTWAEMTLTQVILPAYPEMKNMKSGDARKVNGLTYRCEIDSLSGVTEYSVSSADVTVIWTKYWQEKDWRAKVTQRVPGEDGDEYIWFMLFEDPSNLAGLKHTGQNYSAINAEPRKTSPVFSTFTNQFNIAEGFEMTDSTVIGIIYEALKFSGEILALPTSLADTSVRGYSLDSSTPLYEKWKIPQEVMLEMVFYNEKPTQRDMGVSFYDSNRKELVVNWETDRPDGGKVLIFLDGIMGRDFFYYDFELIGEDIVLLGKPLQKDTSTALEVIKKWTERLKAIRK